MPGSLMSSGRAAQLCSVKPDTMLKWIKKGRLPAIRTAGGHYRVDERDLAPFMPKTDTTDTEHAALAACPPGSPAAHPLRCWEYMGENLRSECRNCVAYKIHATWCFELTRLVHGAGHAKKFCTGACQECPYYRRVHAHPTNVLIVTRDEALIQAVAKHASGCLACRFARNGYDASAIISVFRPALVIVGERTATGEAGLVTALANDPRAPGVRVLVGLRNKHTMLLPPNSAIAGTIDIPFTCDQIAAWTDRLPVEPLPAEEPASDSTQPPVRNGGRRPGRREPIPA